MITAKFKQNVAQYIADSMTEVVLNDSISITTFASKAVDNNVVSINFDISAGTGTITKLTFKSGENVLSEAAIYLEATAEVQFSYRIEVNALGQT